MNNNKTALITGSYGGLGTCFTNVHAEKGGNLILVGRSQEKLNEQAESVKEKFGVEVHTIEIDLSIPDAAQIIYDTCRKNNWTVDYLINNAGFGGQGDFARERTMEQDMSMIAVNIETPTRLCKLFLPDFISRGNGKVLNVSSTAATMPGAMQTGFADAGGLSDTKLFANAVDPTAVAREGYEGMLDGKLNVTSGLISWQKPMMSLAPMFPKKMMLDFVYNQQTAGSAKKTDPGRHIFSKTAK